MCRDDQQAVELERSGHGASHLDVPAVYGIEGASIRAYSPFTQVPFPLSNAAFAQNRFRLSGANLRLFPDPVKPASERVHQLFNPLPCNR